ncbi:MAG: hypothetical protein ACTHN5_12995 [Phycisphaerae bacterium]
MYYHAKVFTMTFTGSRIKQVSCEKCTAEFFYELTRIGVGKGSAPYGIGQKSARQRAEKAAQKNLAQKLERDVELVPCPNCRWVNTAAIHSYRKTRHKAWTLIAIAALICGAALDLFLYLDANEIFMHPVPLTDPTLLTVAAVTLALAATCFLIQFLARRAINPNTLINGQPNVPPGTPPALIEQPAPGTGQPSLIPVPSEFSNLQTDATWATFRPGQLALEPLCCSCLDPATVTYKLPLTCEKPLAVPLCNPCMRRIRNRWLLKILASLLIAIALGWILSRLPAGIDDTGRAIMWVFAAGFLSFVAVLYLDHAVRPYRLRRLDRARGIWKISFHNPAYTAIMIRKIGQTDGLYPHNPHSVAS